MFLTGRNVLTLDLFLFVWNVLALLAVRTQFNKSLKKDRSGRQEPD